MGNRAVPESGTKVYLYLLKNGSVYVFIETRERFPKLVDAYEVPHAGSTEKGQASAGKKDNDGRVKK